jgi:hypothetical protein
MSVTAQALLLFLQAAPGTPAPCTPIQAGPAEGLCFGEELGRDGEFQILGLRPSGADAIPLPPHLAPIVDQLLRTYGSKSRAFPKTLLSPNATGEICTPADLEKSLDCMKPSPLFSWRLGPGFKTEPPFLMNDGRVRIAWSLSGKLVLFSFVRFSGDKVQDIDTGPAQVVYKAP